MKKRILLSILAVLSVATIANAEPRFGVVGYSAATGAVAGSSANAGVIITDDMYNATLAVGNTSNDATAEVKATTIDFSANYKMALDSATAGTIGIGFTTNTGEENLAGNGENDKNQTISLRAGVERSLSSNLLLLADVTVFSQNTSEASGTEVKTTGIFNGGGVGIAYLF